MTLTEDTTNETSTGISSSNTLTVTSALGAASTAPVVSPKVKSSKTISNTNTIAAATTSNSLTYTTSVSDNTTPVNSPPASPAATANTYPNHSPSSPSYRKTSAIITCDDINVTNTTVAAPSTTTSAATTISVATNASAPSKRKSITAKTNLPAAPPLDIPNNPGTPTDASSSIAASSNTDAGVVLGVRALELQQEEFERRRAATITINNKTPAKKSSVPRSNPFDDTPPHAQIQYYPYGIGGGQQFMPHGQDLSSLGSIVSNNVPNSEGVPSTVHLTLMQDEDSGTERGSTTSATISGGVKRLSRANSIGKFLRTPLKHTQHLRKSLTERFERDIPTHSTDTTITTTTRGHWTDKLRPGNNTQQQTHQEGDLQTSQKSNDEKVQKHKQALIYGYLYKLGRHGKWQKRWFETDGEDLTYYKSRKRTKLLAKLDLARVGAISTDPTDPAGCSFSIEVASRLYFLCADRQDLAVYWVISLNRVKEARMQIGGLKLVDSQAGVVYNGENCIGPSKLALDSRDGEHDEDTRWRSESDEGTARVMMTMTRQRTKGYGRDDFSDDLRHILKPLEDDGIVGGNAASGTRDVNANGIASTTISPMSATGTASFASSIQNTAIRPLNSVGELRPYANTLSDNFTTIRTSVPSSQHNQQESRPVQNRGVLVRWSKQRSSLQNWSRRISRWAKRMTLLRCVVQNNAVHLQQPTTRVNGLGDGGQAPSSSQKPIDLLHPAYEEEMENQNNEAYTKKQLIDLDDLYENYSSSHQQQNQQSQPLSQAQTNNPMGTLQQISESGSSGLDIEKIPTSKQRSNVTNTSIGTVTSRKRTSRDNEETVPSKHEVHSSNKNNHEDVKGESSVQSSESPVVALDGDESSGVIA